MLNKIFSLEKFVASCQKSGLSFISTKEAIDTWAGSCEGLTKEEIYQKLSQESVSSKLFLDEDWFLIKEVNYE